MRTIPVCAPLADTINALHILTIVPMISVPYRRYAPGAAFLLGLVTASAAAEVRVKINGIKGPERDNVTARLTLRVRSEQDALDETQVRRLHAQARTDIREALQPFGYYDPVIDSNLEQDGDDWNATYTVERGPATQVSAVNVAFEGEGASFEPVAQALVGIPLKVDERLRHSKYEATKKRMSDAALANGYLDASWTQTELRVEPDKQQAEVNLKMDTGPRFYFGPVTVEQEGLSDEFIERYIDIRVGDPFNARKLLNQQFKLSDLGYFQAVEIDPQRELADEQRQIPIRILATARPRTRWDYGVGYGTDTGARVGVTSDWRRLNQHGHTLNAELQLSEIKNALGATYKIPLGTIPDENLSFSATSESEQLDAGDTLKYTIGASLNRKPGSWTRRLYLEYSHEESDIGDEFATADLLTPGISYSRGESDDPILPRRGWYVFADVHGAVNNVLSNTGFVQGRLVARAIYPLGSRIRMIGRGEIGYSVVEDFSELPASQRFFAGGDQSVRGYAYESLGPKDAQGNVIGGQYLNVFSIEGEYQLYDKWALAIFSDTGGAGRDPGPKLSTGVGAGVRYRAPIGSLQLDLAHPLAEDESGIRVHIGIRVGV